MNNIFLTSSINNVASAIVKGLGDIENKKLVFITTASEIEDGSLEWMQKDRKSLVDAGFDVVDYTLTGKIKAQIYKDLKDFDIIAMEGGNTFYLLKIIQDSDCAEIIKDFVKNGKIYIGSSAGSIVAGPNIYPAYCKEEIEKVPDLEKFDGLGITDLVVQPHWGSAIFKESYLTDTMVKAYTSDYKMILLTDTQYIIADDNNYQIIDIMNS